jgi:hypothetical protein
MKNVRLAISVARVLSLLLDGQPIHAQYHLANTLDWNFSWMGDMRRASWAHRIYQSCFPIRKNDRNDRRAWKVLQKHACSHQNESHLATNNLLAVPSDTNLANRCRCALSRYTRRSRMVIRDHESVLTTPESKELT